MVGRRAKAESHGLEAVTRLLERGLAGEVVEHDVAYSAATERPRTL